MVEDRVKNFNCKQKESLIKIIDELGEKAKKKHYYVGYFENENNTFNIMNLEDKEKHDYLNYYWCEYQIENEQFKITMFYKDFDCGSGNIHVLPGAIQVWKKIEEDGWDCFGFCEKTLSRSNRNKEGIVEYKMIGGKPYCEYGWMPLIETPVFYDDKILDNFIDNIKNNTVQGVKNTMNSNEFYKNVKDYSSHGRSGHYMRYSLLKYEYKENYLYYKTMYITNIGFFTKYDGEKVAFELGNGINGCGPKYYDDKSNKWIIQKEQYKEDFSNHIA